jgi:toxin ParE1/3/4
VRRLRFSPKAAEDIENIGDFIARDSPRRARSFVEELLDTCRGIVAMPEAYQGVPELAEGLRRAVHRNYLIFYTVRDSEVRVERVLHGARNVGPETFRGR